MRTKREDFFPSELYWLDRVGPVAHLVQQHGGVPTDVSRLVTISHTVTPGLGVMFDRLIEPDWADALALGVAGDLTILDARVTLTWPTAAGTATWKGHDAPYMILNLYDLLRHLALAGAGRIRLYGYPHPRPKNRKYIPMPWSDVYVVSLLIERGGEPRLECEFDESPGTCLGWPMDIDEWP